MTDAVVVADTEKDRKRKGALLKAIGLDRVPEEQRELALNIAQRYELDLMLKHLVLIDGKPYITRDGLLWVAHRSGQLDGIEVTEPEVVDMPGGTFWRATCSVYRKDMSRPITYAGRYPVQGKNKQYAPEMAVKVAEVMSLRRAFNVSAPVFEERWEQTPTTPAPPPPSLQEQVNAKRLAVTTSGSEATGSPAPTPQAEEPGPSPADDPRPADAVESGPDMSHERTTVEAVGTDPGPDSAMPDPPETATEVCGDDGGMLGTCNRMPGHRASHEGPGGKWPQAKS